MEQIKTVGLIGLGALGIMYATHLREAVGKENLYVLADEARVEKYTNSGIYANGEKQDFQMLLPEKAPVLDVLIFTTKFGGLADAARSVRNCVGPDTIVLSFLNGVTSEQVIAEILRPQHLLYSSVAGMDATRTGTGVTFTKPGFIVFGTQDGTESEDIRRMAALFDRAKLPYQISANMLHALWSKWMLNVGVNQACAVYGVPYSGVQTGGAYHEEFLGAMEEARRCANAEGVVLTQEDVAQWLGVIDGLSPDGEPSMRQDTKAGRTTEVALFAGLVSTLGRQHGIPTPINDRFLKKLSG